MKICICVSGQFRNSVEPLEQLKKLSKGMDVTFIFSIWDKPGRKAGGVQTFQNLSRCLPPHLVKSISIHWLFENFRKKIPHFEELENSIANDSTPKEFIKNLFPDAILDVQKSDLLDLEFDCLIRDNHSLRMLYLIWRANEIKKRIERKGNFTFDAVIRTRPDLVLEKLDLALFKQDPKTLLIGQLKLGNNYKHFLYDAFAMGSSSTMDIYANTFGRALTKRNNWSNIHPELYNFLVVDNNICTREYPLGCTLEPDKKIGYDALTKCIKLSTNKADYEIKQMLLVFDIANNIEKRKSFEDVSKIIEDRHGEIADYRTLDALFRVLYDFYQRQLCVSDAVACLIMSFCIHRCNKNFWDGDGDCVYLKEYTFFTTDNAVKSSSEFKAHVLDNAKDPLLAELLAAIFEAIPLKHFYDICKFQGKELQKSYLFNFYCGLDLFEKKKYSQAKNYFEKAIQIDGKFPKSRYYLGLCHLHQDNYNMAVTEVDKAIELNYNDEYVRTRRQINQKSKPREYAKSSP